MTPIPETLPRAASLRPARRLLAVAALALLAACGGVQVKAVDEVPPPLVDELPLRAGVYYSKEFREFVHREDRWGTKWTAELGGAHVTKLDRLLRAMFPNLVAVDDVGRPPQPPLDLILEPRFEEYSFLTPRDSGADYYAVTIKYRANVYDGAGRLIDSLVYTGYGNAASSGLTTEGPLVVATQRAMRDAGAKFATEFPEQETVQKLLRGEPVDPLQSGVGGAAGSIEEVEPAPGEPESAAAPGAAPPPAAAAPPATGPAPAPDPSPPAGAAASESRPAAESGPAAPADASPAAPTEPSPAAPTEPSPGPPASSGTTPPGG